MSGDLAETLVRPAGTGTETDAELVRAELRQLPGGELEMLRSHGMRLLACRGSVVDHRGDLADDRPRGWPAGYTWAQVPGAYLPDEGAVVIATLPDPAQPGARRIPPTGVMHAAWNLVLHETFHADDYLADRLRSQNTAFLAAREADLPNLGPYERQADAAGCEETYAESAARFFGDDEGLTGRWPHLAAFWRDHPAPVPPGRRRRGPAEPAQGAIGSAEWGASGQLRLDLRAESREGAVGHGLLVVEPGEPGYAGLAERLGVRPLRRGERATPVLVPAFD